MSAVKIKAESIIFVGYNMYNPSKYSESVCLNSTIKPAFIISQGTEGYVRFGIEIFVTAGSILPNSFSYIKHK